MLATITPASCNIEETLSTLRYACQARSIVNRARINENPHDRLIRELKAEVDRLRCLRQDYERNSFSASSLIQIDDSTEQEKELEDLRKKLVETECKLHEAEMSWEKRLSDAKQKQIEELAEAEKYKEQLASQLRILDNTDNNVNLSPYKTNFLEQLENVLVEDRTVTTKKLTKLNVKESMNQVFNIMSSFQPYLKSENEQLLFARINKLLQAFESTLNNSIDERTNKINKAVSFKL